MSDDRILRLLNEVGLDNAISGEDYEAYEDYFTNRDTDNDSSEASDIDEAHDTVDNLNLSDISVLRDVPLIEETQTGNVFDNINIIDDVIIQIEQEGENIEVVDEDDAGGPIVIIDNDEQNVIDADPNDPDKHIVTQFLQNGCGCNTVCCRQFSQNDFLSMRLECSEIDYYDNNVNKLDQVIMGQLRCFTSDSTLTARSHHNQTIRVKPRSSYMLKGLDVCQSTYLFGHNIKIKKLKRLKKMYKDSGLVTKDHGNTGKANKRVTKFEKAEKVVRFLQNYAEQQAIFLPGRSSTVYNANLKLLPSNETKKTVYEKYKLSFVEADEDGPVLFRVFCNIWRQTCKEIIILRPRSDLCRTCQQHYTSGSKLTLASELEKLQNLQKMQSHLELVSNERNFYRTKIKETKQSFEGKETFPPNSCLLDAEVHYSFDMAQQVHIPSNPLQPGPIYFLVPYKIGIFGVMCETVKKQLNYLIPESTSTSKGSNLVVSLFDHYLNHHSFGEQVMYIHADNCVAQNKNNILMGYLAWRVSTHKNLKIVLSFLPVGHTKFSCDWAFGLLKKKFRVTYISSIDEFERSIEQSTPTSKVNSAIAIGNEKGEVTIPVHDWQM